MRTTLVILAAGIGSRFMGGIKQLTPVGPNGELIIDYSIHDAIKAGFNKIILIIRKDIEKNFRETIGNRIEHVCADLDVEIVYAFQSLENAPLPIPRGRTKPWGTGHAVLSCEGLISEPFAVINSDDYYGRDSFEKAVLFLKANQYGLIAYPLRKTLSDNGGVTRGICYLENGTLCDIIETQDITRTPNGVATNGKIIPSDTLVSMNFWCFPAEFIGILKKEFPVFLANLSDPLRDEFILSVIMDRMLKAGIEIAVLPTDAEWFGVTYQEDKPSVISSFQKLYENGIYNQDNLYWDIL